MSIVDQKDHFEIQYKGVTLKVEQLKLSGYVAFRVEFSSSRQPLVVARATNANAVKFWTSIPEGRQKEAEGVAALIEEYLTSKK
jgi:hypothetical protein